MELIRELLPLVVILIGGGGIINTLIIRHYTKHDQVQDLCKVNNRQAEELVILSSSMNGVLRVVSLLVDALHDKEVLNGNSAEVKKVLADAKRQLDSYTKEKKDKGLFMEVKHG